MAEEIFFFQRRVSPRTLRPGRLPDNQTHKIVDHVKRESIEGPLFLTALRKNLIENYSKT